MRHAVTELVATWLDDADETYGYGVNALLAGVPRKTGDSVPPDVVKVAHEYADDFVVNDEAPPAVPALIVAVGEVEVDWTGWGLPTPQGGTTTGAAVIVAYAGRDKLGAKSRRECAYTLEAVKQSLLQLGAKAGRDTGGRTLRGVHLLQVLRVQDVPLKKDLGRGSLAGAVVALCQVFDTNL